MVTCTQRQPWEACSWGGPSATARVTVPPSGVNLRALLRPLFTHWSSRWRSPSTVIASRGEGRGGACRRTPRVRARAENMPTASRTRCASATGTRLISRRPLSIRSKSSMSLNIPSISDASEESVRHWSEASAGSMEAGSATASSRPSETWITASRGLRRSCITMRMRRLRASLDAVALAMSSACLLRSTSRWCRSCTKLRTDLWKYH
mmetsp:Transcript_3592/g.11978  ORF Transcript_3592/g.11978 Transcript_3592/m.11978 type:complete len:208 (-) Transcript_3592:777-1400(-)